MNTNGLAVRGSRIGIFEPSRERLDQLGAWFHAEYPSLLRFAYFVTGDATEAQDVVQEAFVRLYRSTGRVGDAGFKAYARKTVLNIHRSTLRRPKREHLLREDTTVSADTGQIALRDQVWNALSLLSPKQRAVVALRFYEDMKESEIATSLDMSVGSVKKHMDRAMTKLREHLDPRRES